MGHGSWINTVRFPFGVVKGWNFHITQLRQRIIVTQLMVDPETKRILSCKLTNIGLGSYNTDSGI